MHEDDGTTERTRATRRWPVLAALAAAAALAGCDLYPLAEKDETETQPDWIDSGDWGGCRSAMTCATPDTGPWVPPVETGDTGVVPDTGAVDDTGAGDTGAPLP